MSQTKTEALRKIEQKEAVVSVIGLGYVGLPLAIVLAESGYAVIGFTDSTPCATPR